MVKKEKEEKKKKGRMEKYISWLPAGHLLLITQPRHDGDLDLIIAAIASQQRIASRADA